MPKATVETIVASLKERKAQLATLEQGGDLLAQVRIEAAGRRLGEVIELLEGGNKPAAALAGAEPKPKAGKKKQPAAAPAPLPEGVTPFSVTGPPLEG